MRVSPRLTAVALYLLAVLTIGTSCKSRSPSQSSDKPKPAKQSQTAVQTKDQKQPAAVSDDSPLSHPGPDTASTASAATTMNFLLMR